jgi:hypothetical protein
MLSTLRREWAAWRSMMRFLAYVRDVDFRPGFDDQREIGPKQPGLLGTCGERSRAMDGDDA